MVEVAEPMHHDLLLACGSGCRDSLLETPMLERTDRIAKVNLVLCVKCFD